MADRQKEKEGSVAKDQRFILFNAISSAKLLLIDPRIFDPRNLQTVDYSQKYRSLQVQQTEENKFLVTIKVVESPSKEGGEAVDEVPGEKSKVTISSLELNPEDIIIMQKFVDV